MSFKEKLEKKAKEAQDSLERRMELKDVPEKLREAMAYSLYAGGKRLRPVLMRETARALGGEVSRVDALADAIEMIHTYSLIHDDLPAMDDDDLRRGKPTSHVVFGEDYAILAGDGLLNLAIETALSGVPEEGSGDYIDAVRYLFRQSGVRGMVGGQAADIAADEGKVDRETLTYIDRHKTGALIKASVLCPAISLGADEKTRDALARYAECVGEAFQIVDDILDVEGDEKTLGKPVGSDEKNNKETYVTLYGLDEAKARVEALDREAVAALEAVDGETDFLEALSHYLLKRKN